MAEKNLRNRSIAIIENKIEHKGSNKVDMSNNPKNVVVNQEVETEGTNIPGHESSNSGCRVVNDIDSYRSTSQLQELITSAIAALRTDIVMIIERNNSEIQVECSKLRQELATATENITTKIEQENEKQTQKLYNEVKKLSNDINTLRNNTEAKFQEVARTVECISETVGERINAHVVITKEVTDKLSDEMNAKSKHLITDFNEYRAKTENSLEECRRKYHQFREQINAEQTTWQSKAGGELKEVKDNVRLIDEKITEMQTAALSNIQKVNTEIAGLREQLAARQYTVCETTSQVQPVQAINLANNGQLFSELAANIGNHQVSNYNTGNCNTIVSDKVASQPNGNNNPGPAIVNVVSDGFTNNPSINELTLPNLHDSSNQIVLHFLRDLDEYYKIKNIPEALRLPLAMRAITDPIAKSWFSTVYDELVDYEHFKRLFTKFLWNAPTQSRIRCSIYQDKFNRQEGEAMTSHYLRYANLAANLQPPMTEEDLVGALTSHYPIVVQRALISGNIKTTQDAINLLGKLDALEARDEYKNPRQNPEMHEENWRPQHNARGDRADRNRRNNMRVQYTQYADESNLDRPRYYGAPHQRDRRGRYDTVWGEQDGRRNNHRRQDASEPLNPAVQSFEPRTGDTRPGSRQQRPPNRDSGDNLNN